MILPDNPARVSDAIAAMVSVSQDTETSLSQIRISRLISNGCVHRIIGYSFHHVVTFNPICPDFQIYYFSSD
jgi:hypothetical protein